MSLPFETSLDDIKALTDVQLTQLLHRLLLLEAKKLGLPKRRVSVSLQIDIPDGGEDGRIEWEDGPDPQHSDWIPDRLTLFQVKATDMGPTKCRQEVLVTKYGVDSLKPRVDDVVERSGAYVLFYGRPCEGQHVTARVERFREAFAEIAGPEKAAAVKIDVYGAEKLSTWTNEHAAAIAFVQICLGRSIPAGLQTWSTWQRDHQSRLKFHRDDARDAVTKELQSHLAEQGSVARVAALSGLGKSRLALEVFRPPEDQAAHPEDAALSAACIYVGHGAESDEEVLQAMQGLRNRGIRAILVIDECPLDLHEKLEPIVRAPDSTLSLLTLDFDPVSDPRSLACRFYQLRPFENDHMSALLRDSHAQVPDQHLSKVAEFAQGFPKMAELMVDAMEQGQTNLWELASSAAIQKLVIRRTRDPERLLGVARSLAVFEHLGVDGNAAHQLQAFADHLCNDDVNSVHTIIRELETAGIAYRRGDYVRLTPLPIAVALAAEWWNGCSPQRAEELLLGEVLPAEMVDAAANQLTRLSGHPWVGQLIARTYGPESPFRQRDLLDSARGSRMASSLAEANPRAVCDALTYAFATLTPDEARSVREGRRNLVWCLEKLAWWPETFADAAWLLLLFATGENETWGNNATNQFCELFHVYLGGTETPATERLGVLHRAINSGQAAMQPVVVKALGEALQSHHFTRMSGADVQGGILPRKDWGPRTWDDIWTYWKMALEMLNIYLTRDDELGIEARRSVGERARGMLHWGALPLLEEVIRAFQAQGQEWPEMLEGLRVALNYDGQDYQDDVRSRVERLVRDLEPTDLESRLRLTVSTPSWHELREEPDGEVVDVAEERAEELARQLARNLTSLMPLIPNLLKGEQRQGFNFGREIAVHVDDSFELLVAVINVLRGVPEAERNPTFAMGVAHTAAEREPDKTGDYVRHLLEDPSVRLLAVDMLRAIGANDQDIALLANYLEQKAMPSAAVHSFTYGRSLDPLQSETVARLVASCAEADEQGPAIALSLLSMRGHSRPLDGALLATAKSILLRPGLITLVHSRLGGLGERHFERLAKACLQQTSDAQFAALLMHRLVDAISSDSDFSAGDVFKRLLIHMLESYVKATWPILRDGFTSGDGPARLRMELTLAKLNLVELVGEDRLFAWCEGVENARRWIARMETVLREKKEDAEFPSWTPFALILLDRYGSDPDVRASLFGNIHSGTWSGSSVPRLTHHREAFLELTFHTNPDVARWALDSVSWLDAQIQEERKRDKEKDFGIFR